MNSPAMERRGTQRHRASGRREHARATSSRFTRFCFMPLL
jgi:hypothetical protein